jgi:NNP family nitrate/nitrite transporter-like MFS transporter
MRNATRLNLLNFSSPAMRAFHLSWLAFFLCFFGWFGIAPLMPVIRQEMHLTKTQIGNLAIASVLATVFARMAIGWVCDRVGPRLAYTWLLAIGAIPVMGVGLAHNYETLAAFRLAIGAIGASFVITQYHTSLMFAPNVVGTANAASAGWGNLGGGVTQIAMPLLFGSFCAIAPKQAAWRLAMVVPGVAMLLLAIAYYRLTTDTLDGNFRDLRAKGLLHRPAVATGFAVACRDFRVWALFCIYAACFGMELTVDNIAALYFADYFHLGLAAAGLVAGSFGTMNLFARALGGIASDRCYKNWGLRGRVWLLAGTLFMEGLGLMLFSRMRVLALAIPAMLLTGLFIKMSNGGTYSIVPFLKKGTLGAGAGIVGAGGNIGSVLASLLFRGSMPWPQALFLLGTAVVLISTLTVALRFSEHELSEARRQTDIHREPLLAPVAGGRN